MSKFLPGSQLHMQTVADEKPKSMLEKSEYFYLLVFFDYQKNIQRYFCCLNLKCIVKMLVESCLQKGNL